jgi:NAD(P)-dependent dehydrogenase (short-subunit alcohol dehydrogenase family)
MSTPVVLITRARTGIGRATVVAFSRALGLNKADIKSAQVR